MDWWEKRVSDSLLKPVLTTMENNMAKFWGWRTLHLRCEIEAADEDEAQDKLDDIDESTMECVDSESGVVPVPEA